MRRMIQVGSVLVVLTFLGVRPVAAGPILLTGLSDSGLTATVSNYTLTGNVFAFDLTDTSPGTAVRDFGEAMGGATQVQMPLVISTNVPTTVVPTAEWFFEQPTPPNPSFPTVPAGDWALFVLQPTPGLPANQAWHFAFTLSNTGGLTAEQLADGLIVREQGPGVTDIVGTFPHTASVPEPTTLALLGTGFAVQSFWRRRLRR